MDNFTFECNTKIILGKGIHLQVGKEIKQYGKKVLLHYGGGSETPIIATQKTNPLII